MSEKLRIIWPRRMPMVVISETPIARPTINPNKDGRYGVVAYTALKVRPATAEEVATWRAQGHQS